MCVCGALHFGSDTFFGCNCCVSDNFLLPVPVLDVYKYVYIILGGPFFFWVWQKRTTTTACVSFAVAAKTFFVERQHPLAKRPHHVAGSSPPSKASSKKKRRRRRKSNFATETTVFQSSAVANRTRLKFRKWSVGISNTIWDAKILCFNACTGVQTVWYFHFKIVARFMIRRLNVCTMVPYL